MVSDQPMPLHTSFQTSTYNPLASQNNTFVSIDNHMPVKDYLRPLSVMFEVTKVRTKWLVMAVCSMEYVFW